METLAGVDEPVLALAWALPGSQGSDPVQLSITTSLAQILLGVALDDGSDIGRRRRMEADCSLEVRQRASTLVCFAPVAAGFPDTIVQTTADAFDRVLFAGINQGVEEARRRAIAVSQVEALAAAEGLSSGDLGALIEAAHDYHRFGVGASLPVYARRIGALGTSEILEIARRWLARDHLVAAVLVPDPAQRREDAAESTAASDASAATSPPVSAAPLPAAPDLAQLREVTLRNGLRVVVWPVAGFPTAHAFLDVRAGQTRAGVPLLDSLLAASVSPFLDDEGEALRLAPLRLVGAWTATRTSGGHRYGFVGPARHAPALAEQLGKLAAAFKLDGDGYAEVYRAHRASLVRKHPWLGANADVNALLLGAHPLGARPETRGLPLFSPQSRLAVVRSFRAVYRPENAVLVIVGPVDAEATLAAARRAFDDWKGRGRAPAPTPLPAAPPPPPQRVIQLYAVDAPLTAVTVECLVSPAAPGPDATRTDTARGVLERLVSERLWQRLREGLGATYAPTASTWDAPGSTAGLVARAPVRIGSAPASLAAIFDILAELGRGEIEPGLLGRVGYTAALDHAYALRTAPGLLDALANAWERERPWGDALGADARVVTTADIAAQLAPCAGHEVATVVGPEADVAAVAAAFPDARRVEP